MEPYSVLFSLSFVLLAQTYNVDTATKQRTQTDFSLTLPAECVGQELCLEKPIDYPTEEIDRVAKRLATRLRRQSSLDHEPTAPAIGDGNNCVGTRKDIMPFLFVSNITQHVIIQSEFFKQVVSTLSCRTNGASCFKFLLDSGFEGRRYCQTKYSSIVLIVYDFKEKKLATVTASIPVDCSCMIEF